MYEKNVEWIEELVRQQNDWRSHTINLIASENVMSLRAREVMGSDFTHRYAEGHPGERYYQGTEKIDEIETRCKQHLKTLFNCRHIDVRPISGTVANDAVFSRYIRPGDLVMVNSTAGGGHISHHKAGSVGKYTHNIINFPLTKDGYHIDVDHTVDLIESVCPKLLVLGKSLFLFPEPVKELASVCRDKGIVIIYDAAHVLGLIAGKKFQDPLREGADVISGSTHKTLPGPQHGMIISDLTKEKLESSLRRGVFPGVTSNHHLHSVAALAVTLAETREFGEAYADQTIRNAKALAQSLHERGFDVLCEENGFTESHTLVVDVEEHQGGAKVAKALEDVNIMVNKNLLPWDDDPVRPSGIRLGSQELTRLGMRESAMTEVAELIHRTVSGAAPVESIRESVREFKSGFTKVHYCFFEGEEAYDYPSYDGDL